MRTVWVMGDQLNRNLGAMARARPDDHRVLIVESRSMVEGRRFHRQRLHLVLTAMRRFAAELADAGYDVDFRRADTMRAGFDDHVSEFEPQAVMATEPNARGMLDLMGDLGVEMVRSDQFLCHREEFAEWADGRDTLLMEDFYRWQRKRLGFLMDGDEPAGGRWNFDHDNREPPPADGGDWPAPQQSRLDDLDQEVLEGLPDGTVGADPVGWWATSRRAALSRLNHFVSDVLPRFGPTEDAMMRNDWHLAHSLLSPYLNLGLLHPSEVCDRVEEEYRSGGVPINSAEGFIRQVIGWREFVWGVYWRWMPGYRRQNALDARRD
ncbi:MAG: cryptochrome/photolyase family protein, partial [Acidimicrobiia bacterium]|nr:cryptochrome/photolyase family protein [Acidimicrobiia bacterium]